MFGFSKKKENLHMDMKKFEKAYEILKFFYNIEIALNLCDDLKNTFWFIILYLYKTNY